MIEVQLTYIVLFPCWAISVLSCLCGCSIRFEPWLVIVLPPCNQFFYAKPVTTYTWTIGIFPFLVVRVAAS